MTFYIILAIIIILAILTLSLITTSKGYAYKHTIDPLPQDSQHEQTKDEDSKE
ncbi:YtzI protein [Ornithinibacillus salinisoli]|uniref:YtzI protein n=1 Tax=Ornithinibacillus salinisoli TaxID=1848459 RepID=A0ABW4W176_9BACI